MGQTATKWLKIIVVAGLGYVALDNWTGTNALGQTGFKGITNFFATAQGRGVQAAA